MDCFFIEKKILNEGDFQVSDKEREVAYNSIFKEVASIISERCINTATKKPISVNLIEATLKEIHFTVNPKKNVKKQALDAIKLMKQKGITIERAQMRLSVTAPKAVFDSLLSSIRKLIASIESQMSKNEETMTAFVLIDPGKFREFCEEVVKVPTASSLFYSFFIIILYI